MINCKPVVRELRPDEDIEDVEPFSADTRARPPRKIYPSN